MIDKSEILQVAKIFKMDPSIIEKDYVLGWVLMGINSHAHTSTTWIFKGGTCLKKCYFKNYRFSEDLDFTLRDSTVEDIQVLTEQLKVISEWVYENSGIEIPPSSIFFERYQNLARNSSVQGKLTYQGPLKRKTNLPRLKFDLTANEKIVHEPQYCPIYHPYSDGVQANLIALSYDYEEIFAEKIRALAERARPRDLYDVVHLYGERNRVKDKSRLLACLKEKCAFKNIPVPTLETIQRHPQKEILASEWNNMLAHQLPVLEHFDEFWSKLPIIFDWLYQS
jgi:predicted nucleotidyltransferase component of viral defense system